MTGEPGAAVDWLGSRRQLAEVARAGRVPGRRGLRVRLPAGGIDIFYIDESTDRELLVMSAVTIPFLRLIEGTWNVVWEDHLNDIREWRRRLSRDHGIPVRKELKGGKLASGRGRYLLGQHQLQRPAAATAYVAALADTAWLPSRSIITAAGTPNATLYGHGRLEAVLYALLQRMRTACEKSHRLGMVFLDEGHGEYRQLYRKARVYLPTGSRTGDWGGGVTTRNLPLDNFVKDANIKESEHSLFIQLADLLSYAALLKLRGERSTLTDWQHELELGRLYDVVSVQALNTFASRTDPQGLVRLG